MSSLYCLARQEEAGFVRLSRFIKLFVGFFGFVALCSFVRLPVSLDSLNLLCSLN
jgi:hypothetical protein